VCSTTELHPQLWAGCYINISFNQFPKIIFEFSSQALWISCYWSSNSTVCLWKGFGIWKCIHPWVPLSETEALRRTLCMSSPRSPNSSSHQCETLSAACASLARWQLLISCLPWETIPFPALKAGLSQPPFPNFSSRQSSAIKIKPVSQIISRANQHSLYIWGWKGNLLKNAAWETG
jgi:hypothetical protein